MVCSRGGSATMRLVQGHGLYCCCRTSCKFDNVCLNSSTLQFEYYLPDPGERAYLRGRSWEGTQPLALARGLAESGAGCHMCHTAALRPKRRRAGDA